MGFSELLAALIFRRRPRWGVPVGVEPLIVLEPTILTRLPPEMILYVVQFLPITSAASFSLCCRSAFGILGTRYWDAVHTDDREREREAFLSLLERDLPNHVLCSHCSILHLGDETHYTTRRELSALPKYQYGLPPCRKEELLGQVSYIVHRKFYFSNFQMAMKRYRSGQDYTLHLGLLAGTRTYRRIFFPYERTSLPRIVAGSLILRLQQTILIPPGRALENVTSYFVPICLHIGIVAEDHRARLPEHIRCTIGHQHDLKQCIKRSGLRQCNYCLTEYQIDLQECGQLGVAVIVTKWLDLGEGRTILDPKWCSRFAVSYTDHEAFVNAGWIHRKRLEDRIPVPFVAGSIRTSFEKDQNVFIDSLLTLERLVELSKLVD